MASDLKIQFSQFTKNMEKALQDSIKRQALQRLGLEIVSMIQVRTRLGYGVSAMGAKQKSLKPLSRSYIEFRKKNRHKLSSYTTPTKSNLTFTGQLLESLVPKTEDGAILIRPDGRRSSGGSNRDVATHVSKNRPFLFLSDKELKAIRSMYEVALEASLKKI